jgi:hypothetical protein
MNIVSPETNELLLNSFSIFSLASDHKLTHF